MKKFALLLWFFTLPLFAQSGQQPPMAGMNMEEKEDMSRYILDVNNHFGTTIALIEHDMGVVMDLSNRVVVMAEGRKREVRRLFAAVGLEVRDLVRIAVGPLELGALPEGGALAVIEIGTV